jgi:hypothetical protein
VWSDKDAPHKAGKLFPHCSKTAFKEFEGEITLEQPCMNRRSLLKGLLVLPVTPIATDMLDIDYSWAEERVLGWEIDQGGGLTLVEVAEKGGSPTGRIIECITQTNSILARLP